MSNALAINPTDLAYSRLTPTTLIAHVKGAPEIILERCTHIFDSGEKRELTKSDREAANDAYQALAEQGLRTLALARRTLPEGITLDEEQVEQDLTLQEALQQDVLFARTTPEDKLRIVKMLQDMGEVVWG